MGNDTPTGTPHHADVLDTATHWLAEGHAVAIATVVTTWGSSPCQPGSQLAVNEHGDFVGSVSGGCVEGEVIRVALEVMRGGPPRLLEFGVSDDDAWQVGLACGGRVEILVTRARRDELETLREHRRARRACVLTSTLPDGEQRLLETSSLAGHFADDPTFVAAARTAVHTDQSVVVDRAGERIFVHVLNPSPRLVIVGAPHVALCLAPMAEMSGFEVTLVEPRAAFASRHGTAGLDVRSEWPDAALAALVPDARTAVVTLAHDPKLDDPALAVALASEAFYVGALGSRRTHEKRMARLRGRGLSEEQLQRLHAPVGLPIGARTPAEIAVSILAELVQARRLGSAERRGGT